VGDDVLDSVSHSDGGFQTLLVGLDKCGNGNFFVPAEE
jgi:hypothetical protein